MTTKTKTRRLLSIDWDFFTVTEGSALDREHPWLMDWGHSESFGGALQDFLWVTRAAAFQRNNVALPTTSGEEQTFWKRFTFARGARLFIMESHKEAASLLTGKRVNEVWNFDAHHDCGYHARALANVFQRGVVTCEDWMLAFQMMHDADLHVRYPRWKTEALKRDGFDSKLVFVDRAMDDGEPLDEVFHDVVLARSGSWTPPWLDARFEWFIRMCPLGQRIVVPTLRPRKWEDERVALEVQKQIEGLAVAKTLTTTTKENDHDRP